MRGVPIAAAVLCLAMQAWGQVNIEQMRGADSPEGFRAVAGVDLSLRAGNAEVWQAALGLRADHGSLDRWSLVLVQGELGWNDGRRFSNEGLAHARQAWRWGGPWWIETFAQADYDRSRALEGRGLAGGGVRLRLYADNKTFLRWGSGYMIEREWLDLPPGASHADRSTAHRWNNYLALQWGFGKGGRCALTAYAQPRVDAPGDARLLADGRLGADLGARVSLVNSLKLRYDSRPPDGIEKLDLSFKSGVEVSF